VSERRELLKLAAPLAAQQVGFQLMGTVDALMLGRYSDAALAGAGVGNNLLFGISSIAMGIVMGMDTVVPQALGAGRTEDARRVVGAGARLAVLVGLAATLATLLSPRLLDLATVPQDVIDQARPYVYIRALGIVPFVLTVALRSYLTAHGATRPLVVAMIAGNVVNAGLDLVLIYGAGLGVIGAGLATLLVQLLTVAVYAVAVRGLDRGVPRPRSTAADISAIAHYGWPVAGHMFAEIGVFSLATVLAAHLGEIPAAAHSIALNLASFTFSFAVGVASATGVRVGLAVGAGDLPLARRRGLLGLRVGLAVMACFAATFLLVPRVVAEAFSDSPAVIAAAVPLLQIAALFQISDGTQAIGAGMLRGLGDTRATFVGNLIGHYAVGLPISLGLGFGAAMGVSGLWWGLSAGLTVTGIYLLARFLRSTAGSPR
jgi:MATE family multidrug resistance protein